MNSLDVSNFEIKETDGVFTFKNENTTIGLVRFNEKGEVEYIFFNDTATTEIYTRSIVGSVRCV